MENVDRVNKLSTYNDKGEELLDPKGICIPVGLKKPVTLQERMRKLVQSELLARAACEKDLETFEDADDFDIAEDPVDPTPFEDDFEPGAPGIAAREQEIKAGMVEDRSLKRKVEALQRIQEVNAEKRRAQRESLADAKNDAEFSAKPPTTSAVPPKA